MKILEVRNGQRFRTFFRTSEVSMVEELEAGVGDRLRQFREHLRLTQPQMAEALGVSAPGYKGNERGLSLPNSKLLIGARALGLSVDWLLSNEGQMLIAEAKTSSGPINKEALAKVVEVMILTAEPGETPKQIGVKVVEYYSYLLESGKITPTGVGTGNLSQAA